MLEFLGEPQPTSDVDLATKVWGRGWGGRAGGRRGGEGGCPVSEWM